MRIEFRLWSAAGTARPKLTPSASVGKPKLASGARESVHGYKPKSGRGWSTSGHAPTTDIAAARSAFAVIRSGSGFKAEVPARSARGCL